MSNSEIEQLQKAISTLEAQRALLGDDVVDLAVAPLRERLTKLTTPKKEQQRKLVTVLFADISGFTALTETLDAEDITNTINALWQKIDAVIVAYGGYIDKHIGDAIMALWGVGVANEDDPSKAIQAALQMQAVLRDFTYPLQMRIGLNTGPVLLGEIGLTEEFTAMGDTVNLASRLEHAAPLGGILIAHSTYRQVRGIFDVVAQAPLLVKGKQEPIQSYTVQGLKPRAFRVETRGVEGIETQMVGRDSQLQVLKDSLERLINDKPAHLQMVSIVGEAGVGKSRLLYEFDHWVEVYPHDFLFFKGRATLQSSQSPFSLWRDLFAFRFNIKESDSSATVREKLVNGLQGYLGEDGIRQAHIIGIALGYDFSGSPYLESVQAALSQLKRQSLFYLRQFWQALSQEDPIVIFLEDIHWADHQSLAFFQELLPQCRDLPMLVVSLTRPALRETYPQWLAQQPQEIIALEPLDSAASEALVYQILQKLPQVPAELVATIVKNAEGNPFYVEEFVKMLMDDHIILRDTEPWQIAVDRLAGLHIPASLTALLQARLDRLSTEEKEILQQASIIGRVFWDECLVMINPQHRVSLSSLQARELIFGRDYSAFNDAHEYAFKHALLRDVAYETVLKRLRRVYHQGVAEWLIAITEKSGRLKEYAALIANHFSLAEAYDQTAQYLEIAAEQAKSIGATQQAQAFLEQGLQLLPQLQNAAPLQVRLLQMLANIALTTGNYAQGETYYEQSLALSEQLGDMPLRAEIFMGMGWVHDYQGDYAKAQTYMADSLAIGRELNNEKIIAEALHGLGTVLLDEGQNQKAFEYLNESLAIHTKHHNQRQIARVVINLGIITYYEGNLQRAKDYWMQALNELQTIHDLTAIVIPLNNLGAVLNELRELDTAHEYLVQSLAIARKIGDRYAESESLQNLANNALHKEDYALAESYYIQGLEVARSLNNPENEATVLIGYSSLASRQEDWTKAQALLEESLVILETLDNQWVWGQAICHLLRVHTHRQQFVQALDYLARGLKIIEAGESGRVGLYIITNSVELLIAFKDFEDAAELVGFVLGQNDADVDISDQIKILQSQLTEQLAASELEQYFTRGQALTLPQVAAKLQTFWNKYH